MSIKARLVFFISLAVAAALLLIGVTAVTITRDQLVDRIDETLTVAVDRPPQLPGDNELPPTGAGKRATASMIVDATGQPLFVEPSGFLDEPDPLPDISAEQIEANAGRIFTSGAVDGSVEQYRVLIRPVGESLYYVTAAPLSEVNRTIRNLTLVIALTGLAVLCTLVAVVWVTIRRGLRPIDSMIATAGLIAGGDLSQRVDVDDSSTEVGQLSHALNDMLARIEASFAAREASEQRLRQFVADASHELRTPLTSIQGYAELYRSGAATSPEGITLVMSRIESEGVRMGHLVEDLLLLARLDQGPELESKPVDLVALVGFAVMDARAADGTRPLSFDHPPEAWVIGDNDRLRQVIDNLVTNARVHTEPGTPVAVSIASDVDTVAVSISDAGPGMSAEDASHVFDRFYRTDSSRSRARGGAGLGLPIVKSIVEAHGGQVTLDTSEGGGTTVTVTLKRVEPPDQTESGTGS